jgi:hypothetical protein
MQIQRFSVPSLRVLWALLTDQKLPGTAIELDYVLLDESEEDRLDERSEE